MHHPRTVLQQFGFCWNFEKYCQDSGCRKSVEPRTCYTAILPLVLDGPTRAACQDFDDGLHCFWEHFKPFARVFSTLPRS